MLPETHSSNSLFNWFDIDVNSHKLVTSYWCNCHLCIFHNCRSKQDRQQSLQFLIKSTTMLLSGYEGNCSSGRFMKPIVQLILPQPIILTLLPSSSSTAWINLVKWFMNFTVSLVSITISCLDSTKLWGYLPNLISFRERSKNENQQKLKIIFLFND